jgi:hypothetical protein
MQITNHNSMSLLIDSCMFIHDDSTETEVDHYGSNTFLLGVKNSVVDTLLGFGDEYLIYLQQLKSLPELIITPRFRQLSLVDNLLNDPVALEQFRNVMENRHLQISCFFADKNFDALISILKTYSPKIYPNRVIYEYANNRIEMRKLMENEGVEIPPGKVCYNTEEVIDFCKNNEENYSKFLIKQGHRNMKVIENIDDIRNIVKKLDYPVIVEQLIKKKSSPVINFIAWGKNIERLFVADQTLKNWKHSGNILPSIVTDDELEKLDAIARIILSKIGNYEGVFGIDFVISDRGSVFVVDVNPRFNSSTYPFYFLHRQGFQTDKINAIYNTIHKTVRHLQDVYLDKEFVPLRPQKQNSMFLFNPVYDFEQKIVKKFSYLCIGEDKQKLSEIEIALQRIIEKHSCN